MRKFLLVALLGCLPLALEAQTTSQQHQIDSLKQRVSDLERQVQSLRRELQELRRSLRLASTPVPHAIPAELRGSEHVLYGYPGGEGRILDKHYFVILHDNHLKIPLWVGYHLTKVYLAESVAKRSDNFRPDPALPQGERSELVDYKDSGFDRGHQAPAADFHRSEDAMATTFLLSNMCPQYPALNRGIWAKLEDEVRRLAEREGSIWVYTGALFLDEEGRRTLPRQHIGPDSVAVPTHFFKVVLVERAPAEHEMFGFILKNQDTALGEPLTRYQVTVDSVQRVSGLDFFDVLPDSEEQALEQHLDPSWDSEVSEP